MVIQWNIVMGIYHDFTPILRVAPWPMIKWSFALKVGSEQVTLWFLDVILGIAMAMHCHGLIFAPKKWT